MSSTFTDRYNTSGDCCHYQVRHILCIKFVQQMTPVCIYRIGRYTQILSYFLCVFAFRDTLQHIKLTLCEFFTPPFVRTPHLVAYLFGISTVVSPAIEYTTNSLDYLVRVNGFKQNTIYITLYQIPYKPNFLVHCIHDNTRLRVFFPNT